ncbi:membrane lipoprotein lipid attachment site-containing protein [Halalkalibacter krulwichiae]|uniref:Uncharacterized protein n=1 Tax=Halalkalibacter krulwichiae TaxID=199441 RepID=A0A1X9MJT3_9BACI|nr:membrane lipoprotein lipid attachment site-containing protein [Halalkalibacter krulwichiae]ARK32543.1 hypothetical protein BkAM31D_23215 [Halalkalibacter krulwichiae]
MKKLLYPFLLLVVLSGCQELNNNEKENLIENNKTETNRSESMFILDNYTNTIKHNLELYSDRLIEKLVEIQRLNFYTEVELLDFSSLVEPTRYELSIIMYSMDKEANEVFYEGDDPKVFADSLNVVEDVVYYEERADQKDEFLEFYEQNEEEIVLAEQEVVKNWFVDCWKKANGQDFQLPSYFSFHDEYKSFDLKNNKWISEEEMWAY